MYEGWKKNRNKNWDGGYPFLHSTVYCVLATNNYKSHSGGMQEWVIQIPSIPILVFVLIPSLHLRINFLLLVKQ